ncbi:MAG: hypothetical protein ACRC7B_02570 [Metamycoplasmataceae bacterium]
MNKKLLLGLGATFLPLVPFITVVSCSSTDKATIDTEAKKFDTSVKTTNEDLMASEAANRINNADDENAKLEELKSLVSSLPSLDKSFDFKVKSANSGSLPTNTTLDVVITVFEIDNEANSQDATYRITGFLTLLDKEARKFEISVETNNTTILLNNAVDSINEAIDPSAKLDALMALVLAVPTLSPGFDFIIGSAIPNSTEVAAIEVSIEVFEVGTPNKKTVIYSITGFRIS